MHPQVQRELRQRGRVLDRQAVVAPPGLAAQQFHILDDDGLGLARQQRIDAQLEIVALRHLQQARVDALARNVLEHRLPARTLHRHRIAQLAVHVHGECGDRLSVEQRELQFAFQDAAVGVEEHHLDARLRGGASNLRVDAHRLKGDRALGRAADRQLRRPCGRGDAVLRLRRSEAGEHGGGNEGKQGAADAVRGHWVLRM